MYIQALPFRLLCVRRLIGMGCDANLRKKKIKKHCLPDISYYLT